MSSETRFRLPRLPHLPEYKSSQNQVDEYQTRKVYESDLHRALQEGLIQIDRVIGPGGSLASPLTTKGDVWGYNTTNARIPIGTDGKVLTADSTNALGLSWQTPSAGGGTAAAINNYFC